MAKINPRFDWLQEPRLKKIMGALNGVGEARFVGGCVRDALLGHTPLEHDAIDIDVATDRTPDEMKAAFDAAGIRWVATGEAHGTLTAIEDGLVAECTTLRADIDTDGRHAEVRFTRDWDEDWRRRDFTINALYADESGLVVDPSGGRQDLEAGVVRFIGDPTQRIKEDALRILRFFRFSARFAKKLNSEGLASIAQNVDLLDLLSRERVWSEMQRTFSAPQAPEVLRAATKVGALQHILTGSPRLDVFTKLHSAGLNDADVSVAALWPGQPASELKTRLKPSRAFIEAYTDIELAKGKLAENALPLELLYLYGRTASKKALALAMAEGRLIEPHTQTAIAELDVPVLPFSGKDLLARGMTPGPEVSKCLKTFEQRWLADGAPTDPQRQEDLLTLVLSG